MFHSLATVAKDGAHRFGPLYRAVRDVRQHLEPNRTASRAAYSKYYAIFREGAWNEADTRAAPAPISGSWEPTNAVISNTLPKDAARKCNPAPPGRTIPALEMRHEYEDFVPPVIVQQSAPARAQKACLACGVRHWLWHDCCSVCSAPQCKTCMTAGIDPTFGSQTPVNMCATCRASSVAEARDALKGILSLASPADPGLAMALLEHFGWFDHELPRWLPPELSVWVILLRTIRYRGKRTHNVNADSGGVSTVHTVRENRVHL
jgi:hypothetical protein